MRKQLAVILSLVVLAFACGKKEGKSASRAPSLNVGAAAPMEPAAKQDEATRGYRPSDDRNTGGWDKPAHQRKIITNGTLVVQIDDYAAARSVVDALIQQVGGHMGSADVARDPAGKATSATLVLRIPSDRFDEAVKRLSALGPVITEQVRAEDVTEEYTDLAARLANARKLEARLLELAAQKTSGVTDLLQVEQELARVREQIETMEGRIRLFDDQAALATLNLQLVTRAPIAATPPDPTLGDDVSATLAGSWGALSDLGTGLLLALVALLPWLPLLAAAIAATLWIRRRARRARPAAAR